MGYRCIFLLCLVVCVEGFGYPGTLMAISSVPEPALVISGTGQKEVLVYPMPLTWFHNNNLTFAASVGYVFNEQEGFLSGIFHDSGLTVENIAFANFDLKTNKLYSRSLGLNISQYDASYWTPCGMRYDSRSQQVFLCVQTSNIIINATATSIQLLDLYAIPKKLFNFDNKTVINPNTYQNLTYFTRVTIDQFPITHVNDWSVEETQFDFSTNFTYFLRSRIRPDLLNLEKNITEMELLVYDLSKLAIVNKILILDTSEYDFSYPGFAYMHSTNSFYAVRNGYSSLLGKGTIDLIKLNIEESSFDVIKSLNEQCLYEGINYDISVEFDDDHARVFVQCLNQIVHLPLGDVSNVTVIPAFFTWQSNYLEWTSFPLLRDRFPPLPENYIPSADMFGLVQATYGSAPATSFYCQNSTSQMIYPIGVFQISKMGFLAYSTSVCIADLDKAKMYVLSTVLDQDANYETDRISVVELAEGDDFAEVRNVYLFVPQSLTKGIVRVGLILLDTRLFILQLNQPLLILELVQTNLIGKHYEQVDLNSQLVVSLISGNLSICALDAKPNVLKFTDPVSNLTKIYYFRSLLCSPVSQPIYEMTIYPYGSPLPWPSRTISLQDPTGLPVFLGAIQEDEYTHNVYAIGCTGQGCSQNFTSPTFLFRVFFFNSTAVPLRQVPPLAVEPESFFTQADPRMFFYTSKAGTTYTGVNVTTGDVRSFAVLPAGNPRGRCLVNGRIPVEKKKPEGSSGEPQGDGEDFSGKWFGVGFLLGVCAVLTIAGALGLVVWLLVLRARRNRSYHQLAISDRL